MIFYTLMPFLYFSYRISQGAILKEFSPSSSLGLKRKMSYLRCIKMNSFILFLKNFNKNTLVEYPFAADSKTERRVKMKMTAGLG